MYRPKRSRKNMSYGYATVKRALKSLGRRTSPGEPVTIGARSSYLESSQDSHRVTVKRVAKMHGKVELAVVYVKSAFHCPSVVLPPPFITLV